MLASNYSETILIRIKKINYLNYLSWKVKTKEISLKEH